MPPKRSPPTMRTLIDLTKSTQDLLTHFQSSLTAASTASSTTASTRPIATSGSVSPLTAIRATATLLRSHTTTLSLLLLTPPLTPSAVIQKIGDATTQALTTLVAAASSVPATDEERQHDELGHVMRAEIRAQVRRLLGAWGDLVSLVGKIASAREKAQAEDKGNKDDGPSESDKQHVLATTGVVWEVCDALLKICEDGVVGLVVQKAESYRSVLLDAVEELKEWGEDVASDDEEDEAEGSDGEDDDDFADQDDIFGANNKLGKDDKELKDLLDQSVKKLKMVGVLYQALVKRRLKTFPSPAPQKATSSAVSGEATTTQKAPMVQLDELLVILKAIPETVDDLASAFYDLDEDEIRQTLAKSCREAKVAIDTVKTSWTGEDDEFTAWSDKFMEALSAA